MRARPRPLSVFAGLLAMLGSLTAMSAVILSDVAAAEPQPLSADLPDAPAPVKVTKVDHRPELEREVQLEALLHLGDEDAPQPVKKSRRRKPVDFGAFEGY